MRPIFKPVIFAKRDRQATGAPLAAPKLETKLETKLNVESDGDEPVGATLNDMLSGLDPFDTVGPALKKRKITENIEFSLSVPVFQSQTDVSEAKAKILERIHSLYSQMTAALMQLNPDINLYDRLNSEYKILQGIGSYDAASLSPYFDNSSETAAVALVETKMQRMMDGQLGLPGPRDYFSFSTPYDAQMNILSYLDAKTLNLFQAINVEMYGLVRFRQKASVATRPKVASDRKTQAPISMHYERRGVIPTMSFYFKTLDHAKRLLYLNAFPRLEICPKPRVGDLVWLYPDVIDRCITGVRAPKRVTYKDSLGQAQTRTVQGDIQIRSVQLYRAIIHRETLTNLITELKRSCPLVAFAWIGSHCQTKGLEIWKGRAFPRKVFRSMVDFPSFGTLEYLHIDNCEQFGRLEYKNLFRVSAFPGMLELFMAKINPYAFPPWERTILASTSCVPKLRGLILHLDLSIRKGSKEPEEFGIEIEDEYDELYALPAALRLSELESLAETPQGEGKARAGDSEWLPAARSLDEKEQSTAFASSEADGLEPGARSGPMQDAFLLQPPESKQSSASTEDEFVSAQRMELETITNDQALGLAPPVAEIVQDLLPDDSGLGRDNKYPERKQRQVPIVLSEAEVKQAEDDQERRKILRDHPHLWPEDPLPILRVLPPVDRDPFEFNEELPGQSVMAAIVETHPLLETIELYGFDVGDRFVQRVVDTCHGQIKNLVISCSEEPVTTEGVLNAPVRKLRGAPNLESLVLTHVKQDLKTSTNKWDYVFNDDFVNDCPKLRTLHINYEPSAVWPLANAIITHRRTKLRYKYDEMDLVLKRTTKEYIIYTRDNEPNLDKWAHEFGPQFDKINSHVLDNASAVISSDFKQDIVILSETRSRVFRALEGKVRGILKNNPDYNHLFKDEQPLLQFKPGQDSDGDTRMTQVAPVLEYKEAKDGKQSDATNPAFGPPGAAAAAAATAAAIVSSSTVYASTESAASSQLVIKPSTKRRIEPGVFFIDRDKAAPLAKLEFIDALPVRPIRSRGTKRKREPEAVAAPVSGDLGAGSGSGSGSGSSMQTAIPVAMDTDSDTDKPSKNPLRKRKPSLRRSTLSQRVSKRTLRSNT